MKLNKIFPGMNFLLLGLVFIVCILLTAACNDGAVQQDKVSGNESDKAVLVTGNGVMKETRLTLEEMLELPGAQFEHIYSTINNYPVKKKYAVRGVKLAAVLKAAGVKDEAKCITVKGKDDFEWSFTREQLLNTPRYYFPEIMTGDPAGAQPVEPVIGYEYIENSDNLSEAGADDLCLILPQAYVEEQTNHAFVKGVSELLVTVKDPGKWEEATVFPQAEYIACGDMVKLQHKELGKVKMYYTLDGSTPTEKSTLYNPSTYQPELNKPIEIERDTTIKVLVQGFGKYDSDIAEFRYKIK
ncbi:MAG: FN3 associated domain-containing protein [Desulfotomaculaceae bacterium]|nr:FN3 associated domain-containing protein [Desulfotomaculaceae bacterium]